MPESTKPRRGFGSLFRKPNGTWLARYPDPSGRTTAKGRVKIISRTFPSKRTGEAFLREMEKAVGAMPEANEPEEKIPTLLEAIDDFLEVRGKRLAAKTLGAYRSSRRAVSMHAIASIQVTTLRPTDIDDYLDWRAGISLVAIRVGEGKAKTTVRKDVGAKGGTVNRDLTVIQVALSEQVRKERIDRNPALGNIIARKRLGGLLRYCHRPAA
jgi:hypothetical protein